MGPRQRRVAKRVKTKGDLNLGDLVLAKIKGFPAWPAKISRPEEWEHLPDPKKYFVQFFGTSEIAFVAPADIQSFTSEVKNKLSARCQGKKVRYFAQAVKEICEEFEQLQQKSSTAGRDDESTQTIASQAHPHNTGMDDTLEFDGNNCIDTKELEDNLEIKGSTDLTSGLEHSLQRRGEADFQEVKPCLSDGLNSDVLPSVSSRKKNEISTDHSNVASGSVSVSSPHLKEQSPHDFKVEGMSSDADQREVTNREKQKLARGSKKKPEGTVRRNHGSRLDLDVGEKKENVLIKDKIDCETANDGREDLEGKYEEHNESTSKKKMNAKRSREKQKSQPNKSSLSSKMSKCADTGNGMVKAPLSRKSDSESPNILEDKMTVITKSKRLASGGKAKVENYPGKVQMITNESNHSTDEDDLPLTKRHRTLAKASSSVLISENRLGSSTSQKNDSVLFNKVRSPLTQLPKKRRAVRIFDDEDDESPKTPVLGGVVNKDFDIPFVADPQEKRIMHEESNVENQFASRNSVVVEQEQSGDVSKNASSPAAQQGMEQKTGELFGARSCPSPLQLDAEELPSKEAKPISLSPKKSPHFVGGARPSAELQSKHSCKAPGSVSLKKIPAEDNSNTTAFDRPISIIDQSVDERSKLASGEKWKATSKSALQTNGPVFVAGTKNDYATSLVERVDVGKDDKASFPIDAKRSGSDLSMKHLIAAAQARKRQAHSQSSYGNPLLLLYPEANMPRPGPNPILAEPIPESCEIPQLDVQGLHSTSPPSLYQFSSSNQHENENHVERRGADHQDSVSPLSGGSTEAAVARDAFEGMIETLSRTKESIGRATRLAIDCAKHGIANEVVELLIRKLENESSLHRRVDLFFLIDSITQCSHSQRGVAGASYIPIVQAALPRLIGAVAPAGTGAQENRRQCRKVLRLWLERKILPESTLRQYMDNMGVVNNDASAGSRRPSRAERAFDDPIREMEGMVVDEYGSNTTFKLPGLLSARLFDEDEEYEDNLEKKLCEVDDDDGASPTNFFTDMSSYPENCTVTQNDRRHCVLKDVDGELEMEDVSGQPKDERPVSNSSFEFASLEPHSDGLLESSSYISPSQLPSPEGSPPLPPGSPPVTPPLPTSPPPSPPKAPPPPSSAPLLPLPPSSSQQHVYPQSPVCPPPPVGPPPVGLAPPTSVGRPPSIGLAPPPVGTQLPSIGPSPPMLPQQSFPLQPQFMSQHMPPLPPAISHSPQLAYQPPPLPNDVGGAPSGSQCSHMVSKTHGPHVDGCVRSDVQSQEASCIPPAVNTAREHVPYNSSRHVEYGQGDAYMNPHALQHTQQVLPGGAPLPRRPVHPELLPRGPPGHFSYPNSIPQHQYPSYTMPSFSEDPRRYAIDEQWRMPVNEPNVDYPRSGWVPQGRSCSGQPYSHEGYFGPPPERPLASTVNFQSSCPNHLPSGAPFQVHGGSMMANRPDLFGVNQ